MQPILSIAAPVAGILALNGRFVGEVRPQEPLVLPVSAWGPLYLDFRPLEPPWQPIARRLTLSAGRVLAQGLAEDVFAVEWPGGVTEIEFSPARGEAALPVRRLSEQGVSYALAEGPSPALEIGALRIDLPPGALPPELQKRDGQLLFLGGTLEGARYLVGISADAGRQTGFISAARIDISGALVHAVVHEEDIAGHARLETWRIADGALIREGVESAWADGAPHWPQTAQDTMLAALQAAFLGLSGEADGYLAPQLAGGGLLERCVEGYNACAALKYGLPDARGSVGLLRAEAPNCARVFPLYYRAAPMGGMQGPWRIEAVEIPNP